MERNPLIMALDVESAAAGAGAGEGAEPACEFFKVGLELYTGAGAELVRELVADGQDIFLDLKLYDIPETVKRATARAVGLGVRFLTVHSPVSVMRAAAEGRGRAELKLLAVTVLTSFGSEDLKDLGYEGEMAAYVERRASRAVECGMDGVIASALEAAAVRTVVGAEKLVVCPGVRSAGSAKGDQKRVATPAEAMRAGASYLVMGRQITRAADPAGEVARVLAEIGTAEAAGVR